jgi:hypothetical protein
VTAPLDWYAFAPAWLHEEPLRRADRRVLVIRRNDAHVDGLRAVVLVPVCRVPGGIARARCGSRPLPLAPVHPVHPVHPASWVQPDGTLRGEVAAIPATPDRVWRWAVLCVVDRAGRGPTDFADGLPTGTAGRVPAASPPDHGHHGRIPAADRLLVDVCIEQAVGRALAERPLAEHHRLLSP